ncbi:MAG: adenylate/guanylate cyclase domain-containing protein [Candidatus Eremiobacteraeota bacterium]|nr:adenylate/guanylate cyclase domain-containing protein [Candidatus Eremiobacteraeota bacterium]
MALKAPLPTGTVTLLFTDIEGSTQHWEEQRVAMPQALRRHDELLRTTIEAHGGRVFKTVGDAFCAAFSRASDAIAAAADAQRALAAEDWSAVGGLAVRMALHTGATDERDGDYFGSPVNRIARLLSVAHGGQVVASNATAQLLRGIMPEDTGLRDLGEHRLKDLVEPEQVWQVIAPGLLEMFPPLRSLESLPHNLPRQLTALIGREDVLAEIEPLVHEHPLVTLVGTGGVGKTRVALQVGADLLDGSGDGVWFVDLAPLSDSSLVAGTVAAALGVREQRERPILETLQHYLRSKHLLLILDNCEHVVEETARIADAILRSCAGLRILATSREPLRIHGEQVYRMPSLAVPHETGDLRAGDALQYGAIALFAQRAGAADASFKLTDESTPIVAEICGRLDGIPLAIELAAARVKVLAPRQIARKLDERFRVLTGGSRTALPRQQTMRALIEWSYNLLSEHEQTLFRRVAIFVGGWTLEAAEAVCTHEALDAPDAADLLSSLVEKSLVVADIARDSTRYGLLESTRAFALEKLEQSGEHEALARQHAQWAADLADRVIEAARASMPVETVMREFELELDNARAAIDWAVAQSQFVVAARVVSPFSGIWRLARGEAEPRRWFDAIIPHLGATTDSAVAARVWWRLADMLHGVQKVDAAKRALELATGSGDRHLESGILATLAYGFLDLNRIDEAAATNEVVLQTCRSAGMTRSHRYAAAVEIAAIIAENRGSIDEARRLYGEGLTLLLSIGEELVGTANLFHLSHLEFGAGNVRCALQLAEEASVVARRAKSMHFETGALVATATYRHALGDREASYQAAREALTLSRRIQDALFSATAIRLLAIHAAAYGDTLRGARLFGYVSASFAGQGLRMDNIDRYAEAQLLSALRERLSNGDIEALAAEGAQLTEDQAIAEALSV